jgi:hypothetical protein
LLKLLRLKWKGEKEGIKMIHLQIGIYVQFVVAHNVEQIGKTLPTSNKAPTMGHVKPGLREGANLDGLNEKDGQGSRPSNQFLIGGV